VRRAPDRASCTCRTIGRPRGRGADRGSSLAPFREHSVGDAVSGELDRERSLWSSHASPPERNSLQASDERPAPRSSPAATCRRTHPARARTRGRGTVHAPHGSETPARRCRSSSSPRHRLEDLRDFASLTIRSVCRRWGGCSGSTFRPAARCPRAPAATHAEHDRAEATPEDPGMIPVDAVDPVKERHATLRLATYCLSSTTRRSISSSTRSA
jgi:hypothetical protein